MALVNSYFLYFIQRFFLTGGNSKASLIYSELMYDTHIIYEFIMIYINKVISDTMSERPVRLKSYKIYAISHELEENAHKICIY